MILARKTIFSERWIEKYKSIEKGGETFFSFLRDSLCERSRNPPNGDASHVTLVGNPTKNLLHFSTKVADLALRAL